MTFFARMVFLSVMIVSAAAVAAPATETAAVEHTIEGLERSCNDALCGQSIGRILRYHADDLVAIFYNTRSTLPEYRKFWTESVKAGNVVTSVTLSDMKVRVMPGGDIAVASYQIEVGNRHADGKKTDQHAFETDVWVKHGGSWKISHAHYALATPPLA